MRKMGCILLVCIMLISITACNKNESYTISYKQANQINEGMSYEQVKDILGFEGVFVASGYPIYGWAIDGEKEILLATLVEIEESLCVHEIRIEPMEKYAKVYYEALKDVK